MGRRKRRAYRRVRRASWRLDENRPESMLRPERGALISGISNFKSVLKFRAYTVLTCHRATPNECKGQTPVNASIPFNSFVRHLVLRPIQNARQLEILPNYWLSTSYVNGKIKVILHDGGSISWILVIFNANFNSFNYWPV